ncbi:MAG: ABC transporter ATP-binding protein, partial [Bradyrhizobium sp.]
DVQVVWKVDLSVAQGSVVALIGSNGAGKTTILRALSGLLQPIRGRIVLAGETMKASEPLDLVRRGIVHVPEGRRLFAGLSVLDNLMLGAYQRKDRGAIASDIERVFALFPRLRERRRQDAVTLSGGEQQMCAIGRGLMAAPRLLLIDELSLGLAPKVVDELIEALRKVNAEGTSLLVVEQDVATALEFADHAYVIDQGRTVAGGPSAEISRDPAVRTAYLGI